MTYQEWIALSDEQMALYHAPDLIEMFERLPYGMIEPDQEKQAKLSTFLLMVTTAGTLTRSEDLHQYIDRIGNFIIRLLPDDTHAQSFALGALSVFVGFANAYNIMKQQEKS